MKGNIQKTGKKPSDTQFGERRRRIYRFLRDNPVGTLSTVSPDGAPHGTVISFAITNDMQLTFVTKPKTTKVVNIQHNNKVSLVVFQPKTCTTCLVDGIVKPLSHNCNNTESTETSYPSFAIVPEHIRMQAYPKPSTGNGNQVFESNESFELTIKQSAS